MTVAAGGGVFGVVESARAERTAALLTNQYLVLQAPVRAARTALSNFQVLAAQAFAGDEGAGPSPPANDLAHGGRKKPVAPLVLVTPS